MLKRRGLLKLAAVLPLLSVPSIFAAETDNWDETVDVLVFGGGMAGLTAAISARRKEGSIVRESTFPWRPLRNVRIWVLHWRFRYPKECGY